MKAKQKPKRVRVRVTEDDIAEAVYQHNHGPMTNRVTEVCPIGQALRRKFGFPLGAGATYVYDHRGGDREPIFGAWVNDQDVAAFIHAFDCGYWDELRPTTFTLEVMSCP